jgi:hypothetical protein
MDALALLCTIHADGPATLTRLRSAGIATLAQVAATDAVQLAALLRCAVAQARRFQREAGGLGERLESDTPTVAVVSKKQDKRPAPKAAPKASVGPKKLEEVLARWRSLDSTAVTIVPPAPAAVAAVHEANAPVGLEAGCVDGLDLTAVEVLAQHGVTTLAVLAACDAVHIGTASGLGYTRVHRWRALAQRAMAAAPRLSLAEPRAEERGSWSAPSNSAGTSAEVVPLSRDYVMQPAPRQALPQPPEAPSNEESAAGPFA